jgi:hypothetical protein
MFDTLPSRAQVTRALIASPSPFFCMSDGWSYAFAFIAPLGVKWDATCDSTDYVRRRQRITLKKLVVDAQVTVATPHASATLDQKKEPEESGGAEVVHGAGVKTKSHVAAPEVQKEVDTTPKADVKSPAASETPKKKVCGMFPLLASRLIKIKMPLSLDEMQALVQGVEYTVENATFRKLYLATYVLQAGGGVYERVGAVTGQLPLFYLIDHPARLYCMCRCDSLVCYVCW